MVSRFVPDAGGLIWIDFDPVEGHEQGGHRPGVVLSPFAYIAKRHYFDNSQLCFFATYQGSGCNHF